MANLYRRSRAEPIVRRCAEDTSTPHSDWERKVEHLSSIIEYRVSATCMAMLGTTMLAKALNPQVNLYWFKPKHLEGRDPALAYSARTLCVSTLVPLSAEYGFSLGVSGREPLNNQPFFRMKRMDDGTPVNPKAQAAFDYFMSLVEELQSLPNEAAAERALHAFIAVRRQYVTEYADGGDATIASAGALLEAINQFMSAGSAGGSHAQAIAAGVMDAGLEPDRVESGRINDPSRHYPGDICIWTSPERGTVARAIEVRDKPVSESDIHIFARRCQTEGLQDCGVLMVSQRQSSLDQAALQNWANGIGINLRLWHGWGPFVREALFWSEIGANEAAAIAAANARARLIEAEVSSEALDRWDALTSEAGD